MLAVPSAVRINAQAEPGVVTESHQAKPQGVLYRVIEFLRRLIAAGILGRQEAGGSDFEFGIDRLVVG